MVNVNEFITSLKVTWLRRLIIFSDNDNWSSLSSINLNEFFSLGDTYSKTVIKDFTVGNHVTIDVCLIPLWWQPF